MAGKLTLWGAGEMLGTFFGKSTDAPANFYLALVKDVAPTAYISGAELDEPTASEYARAVIPNNLISWVNEGQIQIMVCEADIAFAVAAESWGTIRYWALCNADVEGFVYFVGDFADPEVIDIGDTVVVDSGNLSVSLGPFYSEEG